MKGVQSWQWATAISNGQGNIVASMYYGKEIFATVTNTMAWDDYRSDNERRKIRGKKVLHKLCVDTYKQSKSKNSGGVG